LERTRIMGWRLPISRNGVVPVRSSGLAAIRSSEKFAHAERGFLLKDVIRTDGEFVGEDTIGDHGRGGSGSSVGVFVAECPAFGIVLHG